ncbi:MAG: hypothetical protein JWN38_893 [Candidatus Saccharibacteria bacterium]|nr:hypothetical protein [Candidatus Saccharibacteria bacterium]
MPASAEQVRTRRHSVLGGILGGCLLLGIMRPLLDGTPLPHHSLLFGSTASWPKFFQDFVPLDVVLSCVYFGGIMYLILNDPAPRTNMNKRQMTWYGLGYFTVFGCFGGLMGAVMYGWYSSIELFFAFGLIMSACALVFGGFAFGTIYGLMALGDLCQRIWPKLRTKPVAQPFIKVSHYLNADDIHDAPQ